VISTKAGITIDPVGIADILFRWRLAVPLNQRPYRWEEDDIEKLFQDLNNAFNRQPLYFLGTVMFTHNEKGQIEVADGQQRSATVSVLIAAIRDYLIELNDSAGALQYQGDLLLTYDPPSGTYKPKLKLNVQDDGFFHDAVLLPPDKRPQVEKMPYSLNERLADAARLARQHVRDITAGLSPTDRVHRLYEWITHLKEIVLVIVVSVPASVGNSFKMFETLNARGVPATQVDILKNFLFDKAPEQSARVNAHWLSMISTIESYGGDGLIITYIRHLWVSLYGPTTVDELGGSFEEEIKNERQALDFVALLDGAASDYIALLTPLQSPRWEGLSSTARKAVDIISNEFGGEQIRPLMLAVARRFQPPQIERAFKMFLSWSVRFLIAGGGGGGKLDRYYGLRAKDVTEEKLTTAETLFDNMTDVIPNDRQFQQSFSLASIRRTNIARYYLRAIELYRASDPEPQFLINEDPNAVNLEHVLPVNPSSEWKVDAETASVFHKRLGNMVLLPARVNVGLGQKGFQEKRKALANSPLSITNEVAAFDKWGPDEIRARQAKLSEEAPKVWPLKWK
jgi:hypothetical protein